MAALFTIWGQSADLARIVSEYGKYAASIVSNFLQMQQIIPELATMLSQLALNETGKGAGPESLRSTQVWVVRRTLVRAAFAVVS